MKDEETRGNLESSRTDDDYGMEVSLRPRKLEDYVGQKKVVDNLKVFIEAARRRGDALDHIIFWSPPGLGKTTLAHIIASEMGTDLISTSGPAIEKKGDLAGMLTNLKKGDVLFIDEIHRLSPVIEENLYPAMEDFFFDFVIGEGPAARSIRMPLQPFTLIGATTRTGLLTGPMRNRFGINFNLEYYSPEELAEIVTRSARILKTPLTDEGADELARRSRGTPRIANRLLRRVRDFADVMGKGEISIEIARDALKRLEIDRMGFDSVDRRILSTIVEKFSGGPVGLNTMCASLSIERETLEDVYEPYLIQQGFIQRTPKGRIATRAAYDHLGIKPPSGQRDLFVFEDGGSDGDD